MSDPNIKIPLASLIDLRILLDEISDYTLTNLGEVSYNRLQVMLEAKLDSLNRRSQFTSYKTTQPRTLDREKLRKEYLDAVGVPESFRTENEMSLLPGESF
jgi:hypothetical protein